MPSPAAAQPSAPLKQMMMPRPTPTDWSSPELWASLAFLVIGGTVVTYIGFYFALRHWTSARVFSWTFLVPAVAVGIEAAQGNLPGAGATTGMVVVILGVALVTARDQSS